MTTGHHVIQRDPTAVRRWAAVLLARARTVGPVPLAGTSEWCALDDRDPRKQAAIVQAALCWLYDSTPAAIAARLGAELDSVDRLCAERQKAASADLSGAGDWSRWAAGPTAHELAARRAVPVVPVRCQPFGPCRAVVSVPYGTNLADIRCPACQRRQGRAVAA